MTSILVWLLKRLGYTTIVLGRRSKLKPGDCPRCHTRHDHIDMPDFSAPVPEMEFDDDL